MNMVEGASLEFELRTTDETINYLLHEIKKKCFNDWKISENM